MSLLDTFTSLLYSHLFYTFTSPLYNELASIYSRLFYTHMSLLYTFTSLLYPDLSPIQIHLFYTLSSLLYTHISLINAQLSSVYSHGFYTLLSSIHCCFAILCVTWLSRGCHVVVIFPRPITSQDFLRPRVRYGRAPLLYKCCQGGGRFLRVSQHSYTRAPVQNTPITTPHAIRC